MGIIRLGTVIGIVSLFAGVLGIYKDREFIPQLACTVLSLISEPGFCHHLASDLGRNKPAPHVEGRSQNPLEAEQTHPPSLPVKESRKPNISTSYGDGSPIISGVGGNVVVEINK